MQTKLPLIAPMQGRPTDAPAELLRAVRDEADAIAISMQASGSKLAFIAASLGVSESCVSLWRKGKRRMPDSRVPAFCCITQTNLLRQFRMWQEALAEATDSLSDQRRVARLARLLEAA